MDSLNKKLSEFDLHSLFEACTKEAQRIGGDKRCIEYFYHRAKSSRVLCSRQGEVIVADMNIRDWCAAIAWSAPGVGRPPKQAAPKAASSTDQTPSVTEGPENAPERKQPRYGAKSKRASVDSL